MRVCFKTVVVTPVAWAHGHLSLEGLGACASREVAGKGSEGVASLQRKCAHPLLDRLCPLAAFAAEEEFYLFLLPLLFWNLDTTLARMLTAVVCVGLLYGNICKDALEIPRPLTSLGVVVHKGAAKVDSTKCNDYGFPSTHAVNGVSNSLCVLLYLLPSLSWAMLLCALAVVMAWQCALCFGRVYLGIHSLNDVRAGMVLGLLLAALSGPLMQLADRRLLAAAAAIAERSLPGRVWAACQQLTWGAGLAAMVMVLHPQPARATPTFAQSALLCGLLTGLTQGSLWWLGGAPIGPKLSATMPIPVDQAGGWTLACVRTAVGFGTVLALRAGAKQLVARLEARLPSDLQARELVVTGLSKYVVYHTLGWGITWCAPWVLCVLGLHVPGTLLEHARLS